jgi:hypothetical protein
MVRLTPTRILGAVVLVVVVVTFFWTSSLLYGARGYETVLERPPPARFRPSSSSSAAGKEIDVVLGEECSPFRSGALDDVTVVLKLGAGEVRSHLPPFLNRLGRCKMDLLIFSDRADEYNGWKIVDALANLRPEYRYQNPDFDVYDRIQAGNGSADAATMPDGWRLDKYKFLPMMELSAHVRPDTNWFVFIETNAYVNWDNMYRFLSRVNPLAPYYFGSPVWPKRSTVFAHGGSGIVLSRGAMDRVVARGRMFAENHNFPGTHLFGKQVSKMCCGDEVLAHVLKECGVGIRGYWPMFNGEKPDTLRFGHEQWCEAILTMHNLQTPDFDALSLWEDRRKRPAQPLTFAELYTIIEPSIADQKDDWTNMSDDITLKSPDPGAASFDTCFTACLNDRSCLQYEHFGDMCRLSHVIRLGHGQGPDGAKKWVSGWMKKRIQTFKANKICDGAHFVHSNP